MNPALLVSLVAVLVLAGAVLGLRALARRRRRRWNRRPDSVAAITARVTAEHEQPAPAWPVYDRDRRQPGQERDLPTLRLPRIPVPPAKPRASPRTRPYLSRSSRPRAADDTDTTDPKQGPRATS